MVEGLTPYPLEGYVSPPNFSIVQFYCNLGAVGWLPNIIDVYFGLKSEFLKTIIFTPPLLDK